jgi:hypothetical protein
VSYLSAFCATAALLWYIGVGGWGSDIIQVESCMHSFVLHLTQIWNLVGMFTKLIEKMDVQTEHAWMNEV